MSDKWCPEIDGAYRAELAYIERHASASRDAAETTRLRADLAAAQEERDKLAERSRLYDAALDRLSDYANQLAAAQERERALLETIERVQAAGEEMRQRLAKHMAALGGSND